MALKADIDSEMEKICAVLEKRFKETAASKGSGDHIMDHFRSAVTISVEERDIRLLRVYERYLSWTYKPHMIVRVINALNDGAGLYHPDQASDSVYEAVTQDRLDAYRRVHFSSLKGVASRLPLAREAAVHPELTDRIIELADRGYEDYQQIMDTARSEHFWDTATSLQEGVL